LSLRYLLNLYIKRNLLVFLSFHCPPTLPRRLCHDVLKAYMRWIDSLTYLLIFTEFHFFLQELKQKKEEESLEVELSIPISY